MNIHIAPEGVELDLETIVDFWNRFRVEEWNLNSATQEKVERLERRATDCLNQSPPDLEGALTATREAEARIHGRTIESV